MNQRVRRQKGTVIILIAVMVLALTGVAGLAVDLGRAYIVKAKLGEALDAALMAAARSDPASRNAVIDRFFNANFSAGWMGTTSRSYSLSTVGSTTTVTGNAVLPTYFMRMFGYQSIPIGGVAELFQPPTYEL